VCCAGRYRGRRVVAQAGVEFMLPLVAAVDRILAVAPVIELLRERAHGGGRHRDRLLRGGGDHGRGQEEKDDCDGSRFHAGPSEGRSVAREDHSVMKQSPGCVQWN